MRRSTLEEGIPLSVALRSGNPVVESRRRDALEERLSEERVRGCERGWDQLTEQEQGDRRERVVDAIGILLKARQRGSIETASRILADLTGGPLEDGRTMRPRYLLKGLEDQALYKLLAATWTAMNNAGQKQPEGQEDDAAIFADPRVEKGLDEIERLFKKFGGRG